jgi:hypothetical protein
MQTMQKTQRRILLTTGDYARRLSVDYRALQAAVDNGAIEPAAETLSGRFLFDPQNLSADAQVAAAFRRK